MPDTGTFREVIHPGRLLTGCLPDRDTVRVPEDPSEPVFTILLVCTGNICRSALAERLGRAYLTATLGDGATAAIRIVSAGTGAVVDSAMHPDSARVLRGYGAEPGDFRARQLVEGIVAEADLTLTMTRRHRHEVLRLAPRALARTYTLREAHHLLGLLDEDWRPHGDRLYDRAGSLVKALAAARSRRSMDGVDKDDGDDDVPDPISGPLEAHVEAGNLVAAALLPVLDRIVALDTAAPRPDGA
jgi:protein-tyrosine-phosphatase